MQGGITLELYQKHSEEIQLANQYETDLKCVTAIALSLAFLLSGRIAKELPIAHSLDCELLYQRKPFRIFYFNRQLYVFPFSFPSGLRSNIQCMVEPDEERNKESYQLMVEKQQEICRGNYPSKKSP